MSKKYISCVVHNDYVGKWVKDKAQWPAENGVDKR